MQRKIRTFLSSILLIIFLGILCACQPESTNRSSESTALPQLKIGMDILTPFFYIDEGGDPAGIDVDIAIEACRRAGYTPDFVHIPWDDKDRYLEDGTVDCLWNAFAEDGREEQYLWTVPYMESRLRVIVDQHAPDRTIDGLPYSMGVAVRAGSKDEEVFMNRSSDPTSSPLRIYSCSTFEIAQTAFIKGYTSALSCHEVVLQQMLKNYPGLYRFLDGSLTTVNLGVAFDKDSPADAYKSLNQAIAEMKEDGTIGSILARYAESYTSEKED